MSETVAGPGEVEALAGRTPVLRVEGFAGPLDFLLELVRRQRLDLAPLSIVALTEQFVAAWEASAGRVPLEQRGAWLVLAAELVRLKSQLLAPRSAAEAAEAEMDATRRLGQWQELAAMRRAAAWLGARPQLGREMHARGHPERPPQPQAAAILAFWEATLAMLEGRAAPQRAAPVPPPPPLDLWRVPEALVWLRRRLAEHPESGLLTSFLPRISKIAPQARLRRRAALASTFVAALELAREGELHLAQAAAFAPISLQMAR
ncbi:segregation and condensation protein A [Teichococcus coralli]|nr:ScpA family protein [Pseudoroseomonas coralli]